MIEGELAKAIVQDADSSTLQATAESLGMTSLVAQAATAVEAGQLSATEVTRTI